jgi:hypothetical protein
MFGVAPAPITPDVLQTSSIAALASSTRSRLKRQASGIRRRRLLETPSRWGAQFAEFGPAGFVSSVLENTRLAMMSKAQRSSAVLRSLGREVRQ